jgi:hypothetical protein
LIRRALFRVLPAIEFDDYAQSGATEIDNIRTDRMLTPKLSAKHLPVS